MSMSSESDETKVPQDGFDSPSLDGANSDENVGPSSPLKKGPWTSAEDEILIDYVQKHGEGNWNAVKKNTGLSRCGKSCRLRWANHLRPDLKKGAFTPEEENCVVKLHFKMGNKWSRMAAELHGRTDNEIKNFWNTRFKRRQRAGLPIYPADVCPQEKIENQQGDEMNSYSSGDLLPDDNLQLQPPLDFKGLEFNRHLYSLPLLDICSGNIPDIQASCNFQPYYNSFLPSGQPFKGLCRSQSAYSSLNSPIVNRYTGENQFIDDGTIRNYYDHNYYASDHEIYSCLPQGSNAVLNGATSFEPVSAMKMELPSFQNSMSSWDLPSHTLPILDDMLLQALEEETASTLSLPNNSGLLDAVLYESETLKKSKNDTQTSDAPTMATNAVNDPTEYFYDIDWGTEYDVGLFPGIGFDEPQPQALDGLTGSKEPRDEGHDVKNKTEKMISSRPDSLLASNWFNRTRKHLYDTVP